MYKNNGFIVVKKRKKRSLTNAFIRIYRGLHGIFRSLISYTLHYGNSRVSLRPERSILMMYRLSIYAYHIGLTVGLVIFTCFTLLLLHADDYESCLNNPYVIKNDVIRLH